MDKGDTTHKTIINNPNMGSQIGETKDTNINSEEEMKTYKCVIMSAVDCTVGKTNIVQVATGNKFNEEHIATIGVDFCSEKFKVKDTLITLRWWDTSSQEQYQPLLLSTYCRDSQAVLFVYAINDQKSIMSLKSEIDNVKNILNDNALYFLLGNKLDLAETDEAKRRVTIDEAQKFAIQNGLTFLGECSAKTDKYNAASENLDYRNLYELQQSENTNDNKSQLVNILIDITHNIYTKEKSMNG